jgi:hypothetical protein
LGDLSIETRPQRTDPFERSDQFTEVLSPSFIQVGVKISHPLSFSAADLDSRQQKRAFRRLATVMAAFRDGHVPTQALCFVEIGLSEVPAQLPRLADDRDSLIKAVVRL